MGSNCRRMDTRTVAGMAALVWMGTAATALADGATRDLSEFYEPGVQMGVSIEIVAPPGTGVVGIEDVPPSGWTAVNNISDGGTYEADNHKVKWPPFFDNFSRTVSYDITPPSYAMGVQCFTGYVSIDGGEQPTLGDDCISPPVSVPTASSLGLVVMGLMLVGAAGFVLRRTACGEQCCRP